MADSCVKFCYAKKGAYIWSNVQPAFEKRYQLTKTDEFVEAMNVEIKRKRPDYVRVHDSGDYYSPKYLKKWIEIAIHNPSVNFYSYTNMVDMFHKTDLPPNFDIIFSDAGKQVHMIDYEQDRFTKIFKSEQELDRAGFVNASKVDLFATKWFSKTISQKYIRIKKIRISISLIYKLNTNGLDTDNIKDEAHTMMKPIQ